MSSRNRLLSGSDRHRRRPGTTSSSSRSAAQPRGPAQLPEYEPPACPLDASARAALARLLSTDRDTRKYEEHLRQSATLLTNSVRDINDKHVKRRETLRLIREKKRGGGGGGGGGGDGDGEGGEKGDRERAEEKALLRLRDEVPALTDQCDLAVRAVVDLKIELQDERKALEDTVKRVEAESANAARRQGEAAAAAAEDDDDAVMGSPADVAGPLRLLQDAKARAAQDYASRTLYERYGLNNDYVGFKGMWHDAVHGADGKPLPDASKWFTQSGGGRNSNSEDDDDDEDEDLVVAEEHISIHCPLSMVVMQDPYTSRVCKHTFEKAAITVFLRDQPGRRAQCPQTGCDKEVTPDDFYADQVMLRKIQRAQASGSRSDIEDDDDDDDGGGGDADVTGMDDADASMQMTQHRKVKSGRGRDRGRELIEDLENSIGD
ncbi:zinc-finger of the MIZ type in Nse subunit-domain-containing protein [Biscogniauxia sp. FL1348]|nr:zinc-finger of the MIZ type in Nse subunit-domain-containing protein [Biscogniauxia sp. FL1348]